MKSGLCVFKQSCKQQENKQRRQQWLSGTHCHAKRWHFKHKAVSWRWNEGCTRLVTWRLLTENEAQIYSRENRKELEMPLAFPRCTEEKSLCVQSSSLWVNTSFKNWRTELGGTGLQFYGLVQTSTMGGGRDLNGWCWMWLLNESYIISKSRLVLWPTRATCDETQTLNRAQLSPLPPSKKMYRCFISNLYIKIQTGGYCTFPFLQTWMFRRVDFFKSYIFKCWISESVYKLFKTICLEIRTRSSQDFKSQGHHIRIT